MTGTATRWAAVAAAFGAGVIGAAHIGKVPAALPAIRAELGLDLVTAGWVVSVFSATGMVLGMAAGLVSDRLGHRRVAIAGMAMMAAGSAAGALADSGTVLLLTRLLEGLGFLIAVVAAPSVIAESAHAADRRLAVGLWGAFMPAGMGGMMALSPVVQAQAGWRGAWLLMGVLTLVWLAYMAWAFRGVRPDGRPREAPETVWRNLRITLASRGPWLLAVCFSFYTLAWLALMVWLPTFLVEERGSSVKAAAWLTVLAVLVNLPGNLMGGWLLHRRVPRAALIGLAALTIAAAGPAIYLDLLPDGARYAVCLIYSFAVGVVPASVFGGAPYFAPTARQIGTTNGLIVQGSHLGQFLGPPLVAAAVGIAGGWQAGAWVFAACGAGALALAVLIGLEERRAAAAQGSSESSTP